MAQKGVITTSDYLSYDEYKRLVHCLETDKNYRGELYAIISFCTALRTSDVRKLPWNKVLAQGFDVTEQKTRKSKHVKINGKVHDKIVFLYKKLGKPDINSLVFLNKKTNKQISSQYVNRVMKTWKEKYNLDVDNFSTHSFRKSFGRWFYNQKGQTDHALMLLSKYFQHSSPEITRVYIGLDQQEIDEMFNEIDV